MNIIKKIVVASCLLGVGQLNLAKPATGAVIRQRVGGLVSLVGAGFMAGAQVIGMKPGCTGKKAKQIVCKFNDIGSYINGLGMSVKLDHKYDFVDDRSGYQISAGVILFALSVYYAPTIFRSCVYEPIKQLASDDKK